MINNIKFSLFSTIGHIPYLLFRGIFNLNYASSFSIIFVFLFILFKRNYDKKKGIKTTDLETDLNTESEIKTSKFPANDFLYIVVSTIIISFFVVIFALIILCVIKGVSIKRVFDYSDLLIPLLYDFLIQLFSIIFIYLIYIFISIKENII
jgi:hypothetical protein